MDSDFLLGFDVDINSLEQAMDKVNTAITNGLSSEPVEKMEKEILNLGGRVTELAQKFNNAGSGVQTFVRELGSGLSGATREMVALVNTIDRLASTYSRFPSLNNLRNVGLTPGAIGGLASVFNDRSFDPSQMEKAWGSLSVPASVQYSQRNFNDLLGVTNSKAKAANTAFAEMLQSEEAQAKAATRSLNQQLAALERLQAKAASINEEMLAQGRTSAINARPSQGMANAFMLDPQVFDATKNEYSEIKDKINEVNKASTQLSNNSFARLSHSILAWTALNVAIDAVFNGIEAVNTELQRSVDIASKQQVQGVLFGVYQNAARSGGMSTDNTGFNQIIEGSRKLAVAYGDNLNDVIQDVSLWYKATGNLNGSLAMTNEALKLQLVTGTDLEDTYRTLTALSQQAAEIKMAPDDKTTFTLAKTNQVLNMIVAASAAAGAGFKQLGESGNALGEASNAADILLHAMEQDTAALGKVGLTMREVIALNQSLITAMGNTGDSADNAAERMARLVGGLAELSKPGNSKKLEQGIGVTAFQKLQEILNHSADGGFLEKFVGFYKSLDTTSKNVLDTTIAGNRQYEITANLVHEVLNGYQDIYKATGDKNALDRAAVEMQDVMNTRVHQLGSEWQVVISIIGTGLLPLLTEAAVIASKILPNILKYTTSESDINTALSSNKDFNNLYKAYQGSNNISLITPDAHLQALNAFLQQRAEAKRVKLPFDPLGIGEKETILKLFSTPYGKSGISYGQKLGLGNLLGSTAMGTAGTLSEISNYPGGPEAYITKMFKAQEFKDALAHLKTTGTGEASLGLPSPINTTKPRTEAQQNTSAIDLMKNALSNYLSVQREAATSNQSYISYLEHLNSLYGITADSLGKIRAAYTHQNNILTTTNKTLSEQKQPFQEQIKNAQEHLKTTAKTSPEYQQWIQDLTKAENAVREINRAISENTIKMRENTLTVKESQNRLAQQNLDRFNVISDKNISNAESAFRSGQTSLSSVINAYNQAITGATERIKAFVPHTEQANQAIQQQADLVQRAKTTISEYSKTLHDELNRDLDSTKTAMASLLENIPGASGKDILDKGLAELSKTVNEQEKTYAKLKAQIGNDPAYSKELDQLASMYEAYDQLDQKVLEYKQHVDDVKNSLVYKAVNSSLTSIQGSISSSVVETLFGTNPNTDQTLTNINSEIDVLKQEKQQYTDIYNEIIHKTALQKAAHDEQMRQIDQEIKHLQDEAKAREEALKNPPLLKKVAENITKSITESLLKELQTNLMQSIFKIKPDPSLLAAFNSYKQTLETDFKPTSQNLIESISGNNTTSFYTSTQTLQTAFTQFHSDAQTLAGVVGGTTPGSIGDNSVSPTLLSLAQQAQESNSTSLALAAASIPIVTGGGLALAGGMASGGGSFLSNLFGIGSGGSSGIGGFLTMLGGGGTIGGAIGSAAALTSLIGSSKNPGDSALGALAGIAGVGAISAGSLLGTGIMGGLPGLLAAGPAGWAAILGGALLGGTVGGLFGPHTSPGANPDIYYTQQFGQGLANVGGSGTSREFGGGLVPGFTANGTTFNEDPTLTSALGGQGQGQFIRDFINSNPQAAASLLTPQEMALFSGQGNFGEYMGKAGQMTLDNGQVVSWQDLISAANDATQAIQNFKQNLNSASQAVITSFNQFGSGVGFFPYSWNTPGYEPPNNPYPMPTPTGPSGTTTSPTSPTTPTVPTGGGSGGPQLPISGGGGNHLRAEASYNYSPSGGPQSASTPLYATFNVQLDGRTVAQNTQAYQLQTARRGFNNIT